MSQVRADYPNLSNKQGINKFLLPKLCDADRKELSRQPQDKIDFIDTFIGHEGVYYLFANDFLTFRQILKLTQTQINSLTDNRLQQLYLSKSKAITVQELLALTDEQRDLIANGDFYHLLASGQISVKRLLENQNRIATTDDISKFITASSRQKSSPLLQMKVVDLSPSMQEVKLACEVYLAYLERQLDDDECPRRDLVEKKISVVESSVKLLQDGNFKSCIDHLQSNKQILAANRDAGFIAFALKILALVGVTLCTVGVGSHYAYRSLFVTRGQRLLEQVNHIYSSMPRA